MRQAKDSATGAAVFNKHESAMATTMEKVSTRKSIELAEANTDFRGRFHDVCTGSHTVLADTALSMWKESNVDVRNT